MDFESDFLVIGSGIAGLSAALRLAVHGSVTVLCKRSPSESNTRYAQGGIASVFHPDDSFEQHINDTMNAGAGLCHRDAVRLMVERGPNLIRELDNMGVEFTRTDSGAFDLGREGGHQNGFRLRYSSDRRFAIRTHPLQGDYHGYSERGRGG